MLTRKKFVKSVDRDNCNVSERLRSGEHHQRQQQQQQQQKQLGEDVSQIYLDIFADDDKALNKSEPKSADFCSDCEKSSEDSRHKSSINHQLRSASSKSTVKTVYGIPERNRGFRLLLDSGWDRERGLGPEGKEGRKLPIKTVLKKDRKGFGAESDSKPRVTHYPNNITEGVTKNNKKKYANLRIEKSSTIRKRDKIKKELNEAALARKFRREFSDPC